MTRLKKFITAAEHAWLDVVFSAGVGTEVEFRPLPARFNTRKKIFRFFRTFWSPAIAQRMLCNLPLRVIKGRLSVLVSPDRPDVADTAKSVSVIFRLGNLLFVRAVLTNSAQVVQFYLIKKTRCGFQIVNRTSLTDFRYRPCRRKIATVKPRV